MKVDGRGKHGKQGRKATGIVRTEKLNGSKFTKDEKEEIISVWKESGMKQYEFILASVRLFKKKYKTVR